MTNDMTNLVLEHLRHIRSAVDTIREDMRELKVRQNEMAHSIAGVRRDQAGAEESTAHVHARLDRLAEEIERIKRRLELSENP